MTSGATAEEFILIPRRMYVQSRPATEQILRDPSISNKSAYVSLISNRKPSRTAKRQAAKAVDEQQPADSEVADVKNSVFESLKTLSAAQTAKSAAIFDRIIQNSKVHIDADGKITLDGFPTRTHASAFLYNLQQPMKKLSDAEKTEYTSILSPLQLPDHLVSNKIAKAIVHATYTTPAGDQTIKTPGKPTTSGRQTTPPWEPHQKKRRIKELQKSTEKPVAAWPQEDTEDEEEEGLSTGYSFPIPKIPDWFSSRR